LTASTGVRTASRVLSTTVLDHESSCKTCGIHGNEINVREFVSI
jgi:hypothetical protein